MAAASWPARAARVGCWRSEVYRTGPCTPPVRWYQRPNSAAAAVLRRSRLQPASVALADPHRYVGGFQGLVHDTGQVISDRIRVDGVFQPGGERGHCLVVVVTGSVEPPVH